MNIFLSITEKEYPEASILNIFARKGLFWYQVKRIPL